MRLSRHINGCMAVSKLRDLLACNVYVLILIISLFVQSCEIAPALRLHEYNHIQVDLSEIEVDLDVIWEYDVNIDWKSEWSYGWDETDVNLFGELGYTKPSSFQIRRYFLGTTPGAPHTMVQRHNISGNVFKTEYRYGYYDMLMWNDIETPDGVQSLVFNESSMDSVTAYTNSNQVPAITRSSKYNRAFNQPELLYSAYKEDVYISNDPDDYDYYDESTNTYFKKLDLVLEPLTYIYLTQIILHNNRGRISEVDGQSCVSGLSREVNVNTGITGTDPITVSYDVRKKNGVTMSSTGENVDIIGGQLKTFGMCRTNPLKIRTRADVTEKGHHYMSTTVYFNNGMDSTFVFDITDQVKSRYKGGVITVELNMDTIPIPSRSGGSAFDAVVEDFQDGGTHEFEM